MGTGIATIATIATGISLKKIAVWNALAVFLENITSLAYLEISG